MVTWNTSNLLLDFLADQITCNISDFRNSKLILGYFGRQDPVCDNCHLKHFESILGFFGRQVHIWQKMTIALETQLLADKITCSVTVVTVGEGVDGWILGVAHRGCRYLTIKHHNQNQQIHIQWVYSELDSFRVPSRNPSEIICSSTLIQESGQPSLE